MRRVAILLIAIALTIAVGAFVFIRRGVGAREAPSSLETAVARTLRHFAIPASLRNAKNPVPLTPQVIAEARAHWADHCSLCHANDGSGDTEIGRNLYPRAPDMRRPDTQRLSDGELFVIIRDGIRLSGMPAWDGSDDDNWKLVHFVRHLPKLTAEEVREMERLNPKTPEEIEEEQFLHGH